MKLAAAKQHVRLLTSAAVAIVFAVAPLAHADTFPYIKANTGDVWAGGWFQTNGNCDTSSSSNYQDQFTDNNNDQKAGGIETLIGSNNGSGADFGAYALGTIDTTSGSPTGGFNSDAAGAGGGNLSFANSGGMGQFQAGSGSGSTTRQQHCIPDYYTTKMSGTLVGWDANYGDNGQYTVTPGSTLSAGTIPAGGKLTLFVNGNVWISGNITYAAGYNETNVPKFALVVKGNIFIENTVTQLDGVYIAQPTSGNNDGVIWTCNDGTNNTAPMGPWVHSNCTNPLTVNGSLIAKQVNYLRVGGDVNTAGSSPSETINYTPAMVIGGPFFNPTPASTLKVESLVSLPPLF